MIIGLTTLLLVLFSDGPGEIFLVPDADKKVKSVVAGKERKKQTVAVFKAAEKEASKFKKSLKKQNKKLKKNESPLSDADLEQLLNESFAEREKLQVFLVEKRLEIRDILTEKEWDKVIDIALEEQISKEKKFQKAEAKKDKQAQKVLAKIRSALKKNIVNAESRERALGDFADFEKKAIGVFVETNDLTIQNNQISQSYSANKEELLTIYTKLNTARRELFTGYMIMRKSMKGYLTDEEFSKVSKAFIELL